MTKKTVRNGACDLFRFIFTFCVIAKHYSSHYQNANLPFNMDGSVSVEFFFILSGFFMADYCAKNADYLMKGGIGYSTWIFIKRKIVSMAPAYYTALIIFIIHWWFGKGLSSINTPLPLADFFARIIPTLLFLPSLGMNEMLSITYSWYIGAMMLGMLILYPLVQRFGRNFSLLSLPVVIFYMCYAMQSHGTIMMLRQEWLLFFWPFFLRALSGLCMGCISYELCQYLRRKLEGRLAPAGRMLFTILGLGIPAFFALWIVLQFSGSSQLATYPLFAISVVILFSDLGYTSQWFGQTVLGAVCRWLGRISLPCYLGQGIIEKYYFPESLAGGLKGLLLYWIACLGMGLVLSVLSLVLVGLWRRLCALARKVCLLEA